LRITVLDRLEHYYITKQQTNDERHESEDERTAKRRKTRNVEGITLEAAHKPSNIKSDGTPAPESNNPSQEQELFVDICKRRFIWYYSSYLKAIQQEQVLHGHKIKDKKPFMRAPFEGYGNDITGNFHYSSLKLRFAKMYNTIENETASWGLQGQSAMKLGTVLTGSLQRNFKHIVTDYKKQDRPVDFEMIDDNPLVWRMTLFGAPMTNLEGGLFKIKVCFSPKFPQEQPRVKLETPLFHYRVSPKGDLCYFPLKPDDVRSHVDAIVKAIEDDDPKFDPRTFVNPEAADLLWSGPEGKKMYNRRLRRSVAESVEG